MAKNILEDFGSKVRNVASDLLESGDFLSRTIGMSNSYETLEYIVQALGHEPVSLLGHDFSYIFDHVRRNYRQGIVENGAYSNECPKFTFYRQDDVPTIRFADPYNDSLKQFYNWRPTVPFRTTGQKNGYYTYAESLDNMGDQGRSTDTSIGVDGYGNQVEVNDYDGTMFFHYSSFNTAGADTCDLLSKTNQNFNKGRYETLIARFYTNTEESRDASDPTQSAVSSEFGMSHGRNLLKLVPDFSQGYKNPYCRVWTYHHQYRRISDLIRPFGDDSTPSGFNGVPSFRTFGSKFYGFDEDGTSRLQNLGVLNYSNGHVRIAPTAKIKNYFDGSGYDSGTRQSYSPKNCMFSIENLAWRNIDTDKHSFDAYGLSAEQKGPLGGRIMWFPPYNLKFNESVTVDWNPNKFIGRGETLYTYTNTERSGSLSFTLLIDHPSILNYLKKDPTTGKIARLDGRDGYNGSGIEDGVDDKQSAEQAILRFFAGCDVLTAEPQKYSFNVGQRPITDSENRGGSSQTDPQKSEDRESGHKLVCFLYYPNNYSGADDTPTYAVDYLMNGLGTQTFYTEVAGGHDVRIDPDPMSPAFISLGVSGERMYGFGGYEMRSDTISVATEGDETGGVDPYPITSGGSEVYGGYTGYGDSANKLLKMVGYAPGRRVNRCGLFRNAPTMKPWYCKWYYRVDSEYEDDILNYKDSYVDKKSFGLNQKLGYDKVNTIGNGLKEFGINDFAESTITLVSFSDLYQALMGDAVTNGALRGDMTLSENVDIARDILKNKKKYSIKSIKFEGHASMQGCIADNENLALNRAKTFMGWVSSHGVSEANNAEITAALQDPSKNHPDVGKNSTEITKVWRSAMMVVDYDCVEVEDGQTADVDANVDVVGERKSGIIPSINIGSNREITEDEYNSMTLEQKLEYLKHETPFRRVVLGENVLEELERFHPVPAKTGSSVVKRYDNEGEFFEEIDRSNNFLRHKIVDKVRYFDPAFHSVSPEGFSSRLTFLHQCTRQSSTISNSAWESSTAYNLAFGRPPVCVLRVGDFYYTKIIIKSVNIEYQDVQWDLNPEGAGVIPMFADVTIGFSFIGGSDLGGPIARLQNAVSFNYYANASVYDNRAEMVKYDENGSGKEIKFKPFTYPNSTGRKIGGGGDYGAVSDGYRYEVDRQEFYDTGDVIIKKKVQDPIGLTGQQDGMWSDL